MIYSSQNIKIEQESKKCFPVNLTFKNVTYEVEIKDQRVNYGLPFCKRKISKTLLHDLSGIFKAGEVTAIMGPSGSGKTTLLNFISCRIPTQRAKGEKNINGKPYDNQNFGEFANYVMQHDVLFQTMTVRETLEFVADLKLKASNQEKKLRIDSLIKKLKLEKCIDVLVGGPLLKGISGGEKKRTSIAFELISNPSVLILDEPTSGLDSLTSFIIVQYLKELAVKEGKTIIMTIHQPSSQIYALFDRLLLLVEGKLIYQGAASEAVDYFSERLGLICPKFHNPANFFMLMMHQQNPENRCRISSYEKAYQVFITPSVQNQLTGQYPSEFQKRMIEVDALKSLQTLLRRDYLNAIRNPHLAHYRLFSIIIVTMFTAGLYYRFTGDYMNLQNWKALSGFLFTISIGFLLLAITPISLVFPNQRSVFLKQENAKLYGTFIYFLSRNAIELPFTIVLPLLQCLLFYWFVGLSSKPKQFLITYLISFGITFTGNSLGLVLGSIAADRNAVSTLTPILLNPLILFAGFFKNLANLPMWISWIQYISPIKYGFQAFTLNQTQYAQQSLVSTLNFSQNLWQSIGLLFAAGVVSRMLSLYFLWKLRTRLQ